MERERGRELQAVEGEEEDGSAMREEVYYFLGRVYICMYRYRHR